MSEEELLYVGVVAFKQAFKSLKRNQQYKVRQDGYHAEIAYSNRFIKQKMDYVHNNPVVDRIVEYPEGLSILLGQELSRPGS